MKKNNIEIQSLKNVNCHLVETRNEVMSSLENINNVAMMLSQNSEKLNQTKQTYSNLDSGVTKSGFYIQGLTRRHKFNILTVYGSFFFLVCTVVFIIIRRLFYKGFYSQLFNTIIYQSSASSEDL